LRSARVPGWEDDPALAVKRELKGIGKQREHQVVVFIGEEIEGGRPTIELVHELNVAGLDCVAAMRAKCHDPRVAGDGQALPERCRDGDSSLPVDLVLKGAQKNHCQPLPRVLTPVSDPEFESPDTGHLYGLLTMGRSGISWDFMGVNGFL
jgi:hypothetical protein